jgi:hypothetical protein
LEEAFDGIKLESWYTMNYVTFFLFRRMLLVVCIFWLNTEGLAIFQILYNLVFGMAYLVYLL